MIVSLLTYSTAPKRSPSSCFQADAPSGRACDVLNDFQLLQADDVFPESVFFGDLNLEFAFSKLPRNNTAFWNLFSGHVFFLDFFR